jgi:hypothetical protein
MCRYPTMRIEAELEIFGTVRNFSRIKLPHNSLLDDAGNTVAEAMLLGELGGLDRNAYQTMFCLDDETLEAGGESILASKGDLPRRSAYSHLKTRASGWHRSTTPRRSPEAIARL